MWALQVIILTVSIALLSVLNESVALRLLGHFVANDPEVFDWTKAKELIVQLIISDFVAESADEDGAVRIAFDTLISVGVPYID